MHAGIRVLVRIVAIVIAISLSLELGCAFEKIDSFCPRYIYRIGTPRIGHPPSHIPSKISSDLIKSEINATANTSRHGKDSATPLVDINSQLPTKPNETLWYDKAIEPPYHAVVSSTPLPIPSSDLPRPPEGYINFETKDGLKYFHNVCLVNEVITIYCGRDNEYCSRDSRPQGLQEFLFVDNSGSHRVFKYEYRQGQDIPPGSWMREYGHSGFFTCEGNHFHFYHDMFLQLFTQVLSSGVTDAHQHAYIIFMPRQALDYSKEVDGCHSTAFFPLFKIGGFGFDPPYKNVHYVSEHPQGQCYKHMTVGLPDVDHWQIFMMRYILEHFANRTVCPRPPPRLPSSPYLALVVVQRTKSRVVTNLEALLSALRSELANAVYRVDTVQFENIPNVFDQYEAVKCFDIMIAVNGAGMTALAFLKPKSVVIEICPHGFGCFYQDWARDSGMQWGTVDLPPEPGSRSRPQIKQANITLDVGKVVWKVNDMMHKLDHLKP